jgi:hypothetical protein
MREWRERKVPFSTMENSSARRLEYKNGEKVGSEVNYYYKARVAK